MSLARGACPSLFEPMMTGDGLLVRMPRPLHGLTPDALRAIAHASLRHGNGMLDLSARGNLQIRGLAASDIEAVRSILDKWGLLPTPGVPVESSPLIGYDPALHPETTWLVATIGHQARPLASRLAPKLGMLVDGGGHFGLHAIPADIRITATGGTWRLALGGREADARPIGHGDAQRVAAAVAGILPALGRHGSRTRARDLPVEALPPLDLEISGAAPSPAASGASGASGAWVGIHRIAGAPVPGLGFPFGRIEAGTLERLANLLGEGQQAWLAPHRTVLITGVPACDVEALRLAAGRLGLVTSAGDGRLSVQACVGAPACASAHMPTTIHAGTAAARLAPRLPPGGTIHISGCAKGCAHPAPASLVLAGRTDGCALIRNGTAGGAPETLIPFDRLPAWLAGASLSERPA